MWYRTHSKHLWMYIMIGIGKIVNLYNVNVYTTGGTVELEAGLVPQFDWAKRITAFLPAATQLMVFVRVVTEKCGTRDTNCRKTTTEAVRKLYRCVVWIIMKTRFEERCCLAILLIQLLWSHCKMVSSCFFSFLF